MKKEKVHKSFTIELILALIIAVFLISSLLTEKFLKIPPILTSLFIALFIIVKLIHIFRRGGTIFEDYLSVAAIFLFGLIHFLVGGNVNTILIVIAVFMLLYSIGILIWIKKLLESKKVILFIFTYVMFVIFIILLFAGAYSANSTKFKVDYINSEGISFAETLYFSTMTFTTVGFGDITPLGVNRLLASIEALLGIIFNTAFIGYILASGRFKHFT